MKFTFMTLALAGLLAITLNSQQVEAQSFAFLGRELNSKSGNKDGNDKKDDDKDGEDDDKKRSLCNGTITGYTAANGTFVNCTYANGTLMNFTKRGDKGEDRKYDDDDHKGCNGTIAGYTTANGTFVNCTYENGTLMNFTKKGDKSKGDSGKSQFRWSADNATTLIKSVYTPLFTSQLVSGSKTNYVIGYGHTGKDVKVGQTINQTQADSFLVSDLRKSVECVSDSIWKKNSAVLTDYQNTALVSFGQSVSCDIIEKYSKNVVLANSTVANTYFVNLIAKADATATASAYLTARRAAEKALFGIA